jgi:hypothetical protein
MHTFGSIIPQNTSDHQQQALPCSQVLNPENASCSAGSDGVCNTQLVNPYPVPKTITKQLPDFNFLLTFGFQVFNPNTLFKTYDRYFGNVIGLANLNQFSYR